MTIIYFIVHLTHCCLLGEGLKDSVTFLLFHLERFFYPFPAISCKNLVECRFCRTPSTVWNISLTMAGFDTCKLAVTTHFYFQNVCQKWRLSWLQHLCPHGVACLYSRKTSDSCAANHEPFVLFNWPSKNKDVIEIKHKKKDEPILAMLISQ